MMPASGKKYGPPGTLNGRSMSGRLWRKTITPEHVMAKAQRVPYEDMLTSISIGRKAAQNAEADEQITVPTQGVWYLGCSFVRNWGIRPSWAMIMSTRGGPICIVIKTDKRPTTAPISTMYESQWNPTIGLVRKMSRRRGLRSPRSKNPKKREETYLFPR